MLGRVHRFKVSAVKNLTPRNRNSLWCYRAIDYLNRLIVGIFTIRSRIINSSIPAKSLFSTIGNDALYTQIFALNASHAPLLTFWFKKVNDWSTNPKKSVEISSEL
jgi:hypothetical protein